MEPTHPFRKRIHISPQHALRGGGLTLAGAVDISSCYACLDAADANVGNDGGAGAPDGKLSRDEFLSFVQSYSPEDGLLTNGWGLPITEFHQLPSEYVGMYNRFACGHAKYGCPGVVGIDISGVVGGSAFLSSSGGNGDDEEGVVSPSVSMSAQQEAFLFQFCKAAQQAAEGSSLFKSLSSSPLRTPAAMGGRRGPLPFEVPSEAPASAVAATSTPSPSRLPSKPPTLGPSSGPTSGTSLETTFGPSLRPTEGPTPKPSTEPTREPSSSPTLAPSSPPTSDLTYHPTKTPTRREPSSSSVLGASSEPTPGPAATNKQNPWPFVESTRQPSSSPALGASSGTASKPVAADDPGPRTSLEPVSNPTSEPPYFVSSLISMSSSSLPTARRLPGDLSFLSASYSSPEEGNIVAPAAAYVVVGAVVIGFVGLALYARRGKKKIGEMLAEWGMSDNFKPSKRQMEDGSDGLEKGAIKRANGRAREGSAEREGDLHSSWAGITAGSTVTCTITISEDPDNDGDGDGDRRLEVVAPAGNVGLVLVNPKPSGPARVFKVREDGLMAGKIREGDGIVEVDGEDVRRMPASEISKLLASRRRNPERRIGVLRAAYDDEGRRRSPRRSRRSLTEEIICDEETHRLFVAPEGKLGLVLASPNKPGPASVVEVYDDGLMAGKILAGDRIVAVDGEDVRGMPAAEVCELLESRSRNRFKSIRVMRTAAGGGEGHGEVSGRAAPGRRPSPPSPENPVGDAGLRRTFVAPAGEAGTSFADPDKPDPARVVRTREDGPLAGKARPGDEIVAIDGTNVQGITAAELSALLESRRENPARSIGVLRTANDGGGRSYGPPSMEPLIEDPVDDGAARLLDIVAPAGMTGVVLFNPDPRGPACVLRARDEGLLAGRIHTGDRIVAVDEKDVRELTATELSMLLTSSHGNRERRIGVLRSDVGGEEDRADAAEKSSETKIDIVAPSGDLGVILGGPINVRATYVIGINVSSPIKNTILLGDKVYNNIKLGDRVVAIDGKDVSKWLAADVSKVLASKRNNSRRTITVSREGT